MDTEGAFGFLRQAAPLLSGAGFGVLLPDWVRKSRLGLKLTTRSRQTSSGSVTDPKFGLNDLVEFRYDLAIGDQELDPDELDELARLAKVPLVRLRGQWVELDDRHLRAALRFLERSRSGMMRASTRCRPCTGPTTTFRWFNDNADGWLGDLLSGQADRRLEPVNYPAGFSTASCVPTRRAGWPGCRSSAASDSAASWRTTWASARPPRRCAWSRMRRSLNQQHPARPPGQRPRW